MGGITEDVIQNVYGPAHPLNGAGSGANTSCSSLLEQSPTVTLRPQHIIVGTPLPAMDWGIPLSLYRTLCALLSWKNWKSRNDHFIRSDPNEVTTLAWHQTGTFLRKEWRELVGRVRLGKCTLQEAPAGRSYMGLMIFIFFARVVAGPFMRLFSRCPLSHLDLVGLIFRLESGQVPFGRLNACFCGITGTTLCRVLSQVTSLWDYGKVHFPLV